MYFVELTEFEAFIMLVVIAIVFIAYRRGKRKTGERYEVQRREWEKEAEEERKRLNLSKIFITEEQFNALSEVSAKAQKVLNRLCYNEDFIRYVHEKDSLTSVLYNGEDMYIHYKQEPLHDILWAIDRLGCLCDHNAELSTMLNCCRIDFETIKGHCLFIIYKTMQYINYDSPFIYFDYQRAVGDPESLFFKARDVANTDFDIFVHYDPSLGQKDYKICDLIGDYSQDDKLLYRELMFQLGTIVAEILKVKAPSKSEWLVENHEGNAADTERLERINDSYIVPLFRPTTASTDDEDEKDEDDYDDESDFTEDFDSDYYSTEIAEITYSFIGSDAPEESFEMELSEKDANKLKKAEEKGEFLDSNYVSENFRSIHRKILHSIQEDLESKTGDPHDGMREVHHPPAYHGWEKDHDSHQDLLNIFGFSDDIVEYEVDFYS
ncbi:MAG: hypothetical protein K6A94_02840 [Bacteroidales bacterium]|nr:hypothetical protein [Bacteroidales bacterium]